MTDKTSGSSAGVKALEYAKRHFAGHTYKLGYDPDKRTIDCSNLVHQAFKGVGSNFRYRTTDPKNWENDDFKKVDAKNVQPGDVILFNGHLGIVQSFNSTTGTGEFMGS